MVAFERMFRGRMRGAARTFAVALLAYLMTSACVIILDTDSEQCATDDDCAEFQWTVCIDHACVVPPPGTTGECRTHADCDRIRGDHWVCRKDDRVCVPLMSSECQTVEGDYTDNDAIFIGSLLQTQGDNQSSGLPVENAIRLAIADFEAANGVPDVDGTRYPLVLVGCDSSKDPIGAALHLVDRVRVPAIIGESFSGPTMTVATEVTIPNGVLLISPSATSALITELQDDGLVWRTAPSDEQQAIALRLLVNDSEARIRQELDLGDAEVVRVAVAHKGDSYGRGLAISIEAGLMINGKSAFENGDDYLRVDYGDPADPSSIKFDVVVGQLAAFAPHIVLMIGTTEAVTDVLGPLEQEWQANHRPRYLLSDGVVVNELWELVGSSDPLRSRVLGTIPGTSGDLFAVFRKNYESKILDGTSPDVFGSAGGFDAVYLLGYAIAKVGVKDLSGSKIAQGLVAMAPPGAPIRAQVIDINNSFSKIRSGDVDFLGASGPLDFDVATGEAPSDIQVWCLPENKDGTTDPATFSGRYLPAGGNALVGSMDVCPSDD